RRSVSCAGAAAAKHSTPTKKARVSCSRTLLKLCPFQTVLIDDDMKVLDLPCQGFRNLDREWPRLLWKQGALQVAVGDPHDLAIVVVEAGNDVRNVHGLPTLIQ